MTREAREWNGGFLMVGNQPALDFLNTALFMNEEPAEALSDTSALVRWLTLTGLVRTAKIKKALPEWSSTEEARAFLQELLHFRECLRDEVLRSESGKQPSPSFLAELNRRLFLHPMRISVRLTKEQVESEQAFGASVSDSIWASLLLEVSRLLTVVDASRIRKCETCAVHFRDVSKKGSRRWCSMSICGNKMKVAAYQQRKRSEL